MKNFLIPFLDIFCTFVHAPFIPRRKQERSFGRVQKNFHVTVVQEIQRLPEKKKKKKKKNVHFERCTR